MPTNLLQQSSLRPRTVSRGRTNLTMSNRRQHSYGKQSVGQYDHLDMYVQNVLQHPLTAAFNSNMLSSTLPTTSSSKRRSNNKSRKAVTVLKTYINSSPTFNLSLNVNEMSKSKKKIKVVVNQMLDPDQVD